MGARAMGRRKREDRREGGLRGAKEGGTAEVGGKGVRKRSREEATELGREAGLRGEKGRERWRRGGKEEGKKKIFFF